MATSLAPTPSTNLHITVSAKGLKDTDVFSKSDPMCVLFQLEGKLTGRPEWREKGRTETIQNCLNPEWNERFRIDYFFEERQQLKFEVFDIDSHNRDLSAHDFLGRFECDLAEVVSAPNGVLVGNLKGLLHPKGQILISAEEIDEGSKESVQLWCEGKGLDRKDFFGKSDPFLNIYRQRPDGSRQLAFRTEVIKRNLNPKWKVFEVNLKLLCGGDRDAVFLIECFDYNWNGRDKLCKPSKMNMDDHSFIGSCQTTVNRLLAKEDKQLALINAKKQAKKGKKYKDSGTLIVNSCQILKQHSFLDFISGGTQLDFAVAIDFTASNGNVTNPNSLHYINPSTPNQYEVAIRAVIDICQHYNNSKRFDAFGFGAKVPPQNFVSEIFSLNFSELPAVVGLQGVLEAYRHSLNKVTLYGPTNFSPVVNQVAKKAARMAKDGARYQVLLIITDGVISDMAKTKQAIIAASTLPLSIIIVGVGNDDFESMDELDSDDRLLNHEGRVAQRDIVQFVPMRNFLTSRLTTPQEYERAMGLLAKEVLAEVPAQLTGFMKSQKIEPRSPENPFPRDREEDLPPITQLPSQAHPYDKPSTQFGQMPPQGNYGQGSYGQPPYGQAPYQNSSPQQYGAQAPYPGAYQPYPQGQVYPSQAPGYPPPMVENQVHVGSSYPNQGYPCGSNYGNAPVYPPSHGASFSGSFQYAPSPQDQFRRMSHQVPPNYPPNLERRTSQGPGAPPDSQLQYPNIQNLSLDRKDSQPTAPIHPNDIHTTLN